MSESRFAIAEYEAELATELTLQALAERHEADSRQRETESGADIDIDPWRPLFDGE